MNKLMKKMLKLAGFKKTEEGTWEITMENGDQFVAYIPDADDGSERVMVTQIYTDEYSYSDEELEDMEDYQQRWTDESEAIEFSAFIMMMED